MTAVLKPLPPRDAIAALRRRGATLTESFDWRDIWEDEHQQKFTVAKSAGFDILKDILDGVEELLADGSTLADFTGKLQPILEEKGWWGKQPVEDPATGETVNAQLGSARRLQTIFETNMRTSYAQGHWARFEREKQERPWLRYVALLDGRARPEHAARHNVCLPVDDPFWETWAPPCGWGCRCTLQSLSDRDVARLQREGEPLVFDAPADRMVEYTNPRTGDVQPIPAGIDPGWAYNPGKVSLQTAAAIEKTLTAPPGWTTAVLEEMPRVSKEGAYRRWMTGLLDGQRGGVEVMPAGRLTDEVAAAAGAEGDEAIIVMPQGIVGHALRATKRALDREPDPRILLRAPQLLAQPIAILRDRTTGDLIYLVGRDERQWTRIVVRPGYVMKPGAKGYRGRVWRSAVVTIDRVDIRTYPNVGLYDVIQGEV